MTLLPLANGLGLAQEKEKMPGMAGMHHAPGDTKQDHGDHVCPFTGVAMALAAPTLPTLDLPPIIENEGTQSPRFAVAVGRGLAAPPPPATGPPSLV